MVDIDRLLKEHHRFQAAIDDLKKQRETDQVELQRDADNMDRLKRQLQQYEEESGKYQQLTEKIDLAEAALAAKRLKFAEEHERHEARIYFAFHQEVITEVEYFARRYQINLVVPYDSSDVSLDDNAEEILHRIKSGPLYQNNIDITEELACLRWTSIRPELGIFPAPTFGSKCAFSQLPHWPTIRPPNRERWSHQQPVVSWSPPFLSISAPYRAGALVANTGDSTG